MTEMEKSDYDTLRIWNNSVSQKSKKIIVPVCQLCLSPLTFLVSFLVLLVAESTSLSMWR